jgi:hypothetical protein
MSNAQLAEKKEPATADAQRLDTSALLGEWINTNSSATGIVRLVLTQSGNRNWVRVFGAGAPVPFDWGEAPVEIFAEDPAFSQATSFTSFYDLGFMSVWLQTYVVKGVLVVISFTQFRDGSGRSNYFGKEFFFRSGKPLAAE